METKGLQPWRDPRSIIHCPENSDLSRLCFSKEMIANAKALIPTFTNQLIKTDYVYKTALSLVNRDELSAQQLREISERPARDTQIKAKLKVLNEKVNSLQKSSTSLYVLGLILAIAAAVLLSIFVWLAVATYAGASSIGLVVTIIGVLASGTASVGTIGYANHKDKEAGMHQLVNQLESLQNSHDKLTDDIGLDQEVLNILRKSDLEKSQNGIRTVLP
jgi:hypothetical protein